MLGGDPPPGRNPQVLAAVLRQQKRRLIPMGFVPPSSPVTHGVSVYMTKPVLLTLSDSQGGVLTLTDPRTELKSEFMT